MAVETELKLRLSPTAARRLLSHPLLSATPPQRTKLLNTYYDTPELELLQRRLALRLRRKGWDWLLTVKGAAPAQGGLARRSEWEAPTQPGQFHFDHVDDKDLRRWLEKGVPRLDPAFPTDFTRLTWELSPVPGTRIDGLVQFHGQDIYGKDIEVTDLRRRIGMVFQKANPFPMSIFDNIAYGPRLHGTHSNAELAEIVERSLRGAALWDEVKDRLKKSALGLSGGQQQRLCIARALAVEPEVLLMDEPTSALDPGSTMKVEELMSELKEKYTVVIVTHNMQQAARISDKTAFFLLGELVEMGQTERIFSTPVDKRTEDYITGRFG